MTQENLEEKLVVDYKPKHKVVEWLYRYGPAEMIGTTTAYIGFFSIQKLTDNDIAAAYAGTMGENIGYYGTMIVREITHDLKAAKKEGRKYGLFEVMKTASKLFIEFGPAEVLDSLIIRPASMGFGSKLLGKGVGVLVGKVAADISFYIPTIFSYELRKYFSKDKKD